jgi:hypothetical protein
MSSKKKFVMPTGRRLLKQTWRDLKAHWRLYLSIPAVVAVPAGVIGAYLDSTTPSETFTVISVIAFMFMTLSLFYAVIQCKRDGADVHLRGAYYDGSAFFVKYLLISLALFVAALPLLIALDGMAYVNELIAAGQSNLSPPALALVAALALLVSLPSFWLLSRFVWALPIAIWESVWPMSALRRSRTLTLKRFWKTVARLAFGALIGIGLALVITALSILLAFVWLPGASALFSILSVVVVLPPAVIYCVNLYRVLAGDELPELVN